MAGWERRGGKVLRCSLKIAGRVGGGSGRGRGVVVGLNMWISPSLA
jgi:hypothetical protein